MDRAIRRSAAILAGSLAFVLVVAWAAELPAPVINTRKGVRINIKFVRASKEGEELVDEKLGDSGQMLKKKLGVKRLEVFYETEVAASSGWEVTEDATDDLKLKLKWRAMDKGNAHFRVSVTRQEVKIIDNVDMSVKPGTPGFAMGKYKKDVLILMMTPNMDPTADG